ncbi:MAG TPA: 2-hydroxychromene-2-carboxylate isomerase [Burkholderiaceae bacterium]|nr:2-hydroxychromene-2-carboxylate isomerase [Burkholderiaceae bacterium]
MRTARWYFDFVSPYAYLQGEVLHRFDGLVRIEPVPVLFAGMLEHHGQKGPAEIPAKKVQTFREVVWLAARHGIPLEPPPAHPFNPLPMLRLSIALGNTPEAVRALFRHVWVDGRLPTDAGPWRALCERLGVPDWEAETGRPEVKATLRRNTEAAIAAGAFGVPTLAVDDQLFWGFGMTEAALAYLRGDPLFASPAMRRAETLPDGVQRAAR